MFRLPTREEDRDLTALARSSTPSSTCSRAAALGGYCPRTFRLGRPSTGGSADGGWMEPSSESTLPCASGCGVAWAGIRCPARGYIHPRLYGYEDAWRAYVRLFIVVWRSAAKRESASEPAWCIHLCSARSQNTPTCQIFAVPWRCSPLAKSLSCRPASVSATP